MVYLYDAESPRGNASFPFRSVHVKNPTDSVLESGPVTVFGEGKFIGEGMSEPIPAHSTAFIPFALDRQIMVDRKEADVDRIARIITVQRGVFSTEIQHTRRSTFVLQNRLQERATVYVKHSVAQGYTLTKAPEPHERLGSAYFFRVDVDPGGKAEVAIEESTPVFRTTDIRAPEGIELVQAYLSSAAIEGPLKGAVSELLRLQKEMADTEQRIADDPRGDGRVQDAHGRAARADRDAQAGEDGGAADAEPGEEARGRERQGREGDDRRRDAPGEADGGARSSSRTASRISRWRRSRRTTLRGPLRRAERALLQALGR